MPSVKGRVMGGMRVVGRGSRRGRGRILIRGSPRGSYRARLEARARLKDRVGARA